MTRHRKYLSDVRNNTALQNEVFSNELYEENRNVELISTKFISKEKKYFSLGPLYFWIEIPIFEKWRIEVL